MEKTFDSLNEFYLYYLTEHLDRTCRTFHFIGTTLVIGLAAAAIITGILWLILLMPVAGYGLAWIGHFGFEKNKPAAFKHPLYSLASDFIMYWHTLTGQLPAKMREARQLYNR